MTDRPQPRAVVPDGVTDPVTVGVDYGTLSGRAVVVRVSDGEELGSAVCDYPHAVLDRSLPVELAGRDVRLGPDWALQVPADYVEVLKTAVPAALRTRASTRRRSSASPPTSPPARWCPTTADGTPLCELPGHAADPHAYVKLWKHHAAQPQADRINELARKRGEAWLPRYGGLISSEWEFAKGLQLLEDAPAIYAEMAHFVEAADWIVWQLSGATSATPAPRATRASTRTAPTRRAAFLAELNPDFADLRPRQARRPGRPARRGRRPADQAGGRVDRAARGHHRRGRQRRRTRHRTRRRRDRCRPDGRDHGHLHLPRDEQRHPPRGPRHVRGRRRRHHRGAVGLRGRSVAASATSSTGS